MKKFLMVDFEFGLYLGLDDDAGKVFFVEVKNGKHNKTERPDTKENREELMKLYEDTFRGKSIRILSNIESLLAVEMPILRKLVQHYDGNANEPLDDAIEHNLELRQDLSDAIDFLQKEAEE